jgi:imidazolonepropionase-like amidohydrolase
MSQARHVIRSVFLIPLLVLLFIQYAAADGVAITHVNVIPMDSETILQDHTVLVEGRKIIALGPTDNTPVPDGVSIINGKGKYLIPGIAEMHAHVTSRDAVEHALTLYVANGVTTARGMLGEPWHLELRDNIANGSVLGPRLYTSGPSFNGRSVSSPEQAARMVREQKSAGYDFLKLHPGLTRAEYDALVETADELGIDFAGHVSADVGLERTLAAGQATIDHLDGYIRAMAGYKPGDSDNIGFFGAGLTSKADPGLIGQLTKNTLQGHVWNVPTQTLIENVVAPGDPQSMADWPEMKYMPAATVNNWVARKRRAVDDPDYDAETARQFIDLRRRQIKSLNDAGAGLLLGSDAPQVFNVPGFAAHRELAILVDAGLTPYEALKTGTFNPAVFFAAEDEFGTVRPGRDADLVLLSDNPLEDIRNTQKIEGVMVRGRWLSRSELDTMLARFAR